jgi:hypothetical protein
MLWPPKGDFPQIWQTLDKKGDSFLGGSITDGRSYCKASQKNTAASIGWASGKGSFLICWEVLGFDGC